MRIFPASYGGDDKPRRLREYNQCHEPAGRPEGGRFARSDSGNCAGGGAKAPVDPNAKTVPRDDDTVPRKRKPAALTKPIFRDPKTEPNYGDPEDLAKHPVLPIDGEEPSMGFNRRNPDPLADDKAVERLLQAETVTAEELGGGINPSFVVTLRDDEGEFQAVFKSEDSETWTMDDDGEEFDERMIEQERNKYLEDYYLGAEGVWIEEKWAEDKAEYMENVGQSVEDIYTEVNEYLEEHHPDRLRDTEEDKVGYFTERLGVRALQSLIDDRDGKLVGGGDDIESRVGAVVEEFLRGTGVTANFMKLDPESFRGDEEALRDLSSFYRDGEISDDYRSEIEGEFEPEKSFESWFRDRHGRGPESAGDGEGRPIRDTISNQSFTQAERDSAAYELDRMLGLGVTPATVVREIEDLGVSAETEHGTSGEASGRGSLQVFLNSGYGNSTSREERSENMWRLATLDWLIGNTDRHMGNTLRLDDGTFRAIDNGLSFPERHDEVRSYYVGKLQEYGRMPESLRSHLRDRFERVDFGQWAAKFPMNQAETSSFLARVNWFKRGLADTRRMWDHIQSKWDNIDPYEPARFFQGL